MDLEPFDEAIQPDSAGLAVRGYTVRNAKESLEQWEGRDAIRANVRNPVRTGQPPKVREYRQVVLNWVRIAPRECNK